jgi:PAS domain S-box-containing protein
LYTGLEQREQATINAEAEVLRLARLAASNQASLIDGGQQLLVALAHLPAVREGDRAACDAILASLLQQYAYYANLGVAAPNGDLLCSALPHNGPVNYADRDWLQEAVKTRNFVTGQFLIGRLTGKAILPMAYPGLDEAGRVQYVVFAAIDLAWLNQLAAKAQLPEGSVYTLIDRQGTILARHPDPQQWVGQALPEAPIIETVLARAVEGTAEAVGVDGIRRLYAFTPLGIAGEANRQYVSIGVPAGVAYADVDRSVAVHLVGLGLVSLAAMALTWAFGNVFIMRRVNSLLRATQRLSTGDLNTRTQIPYGNNELSLLAQAFDGMAEALEGREAERKQAEERYRHLFETMINGFALHEIITDESGKPSDYRFLDVNPAFEKITGLRAEAVVGKTIRQVIPDVEGYWIDTYGDVALSGTSKHFVNYMEGFGKHFEVFAYSPREGQFATLFLDITEGKRAQDELLRVNRALRTISECNQFLVRAGDEASLLSEICQTLVTTV